MIRRLARDIRIVRQVPRAIQSAAMHATATLLAYVATVFVVAGWVKGVTGMGLPTVAMALLAMVLPSPVAAALLVVPSLVTNLWQMVDGPALPKLLRRLWPLLACTAVATLASARLLASLETSWSGAALGVALIVYATFAVAAPRFHVPERAERWLAPPTGLCTGLVTGATGVFVFPAVPYLQSLRLPPDAFVQALGLAFTVSTLALALGLFAHGAFAPSHALLSLATLPPALAGLWLGQRLRRRIAPARFRRWTLATLSLLGLHLSTRPLFG